MTDTERVLNLLLHDLRTPLGVATGYLRLLHEQRLSTPEEQGRALARTLEALGRISRLCDQAGTCMADGADAPGAPVAARDLVAAVNSCGQECGMRVALTESGEGGMVHVGTAIDRLADAVTLLLAARAQAAGGDTPVARADLGSSELCFIAGGSPAEQQILADDRSERSDPVQAASLAVLLARRTITAAGGHVWTAARAPGTVAIAFPLETSPA